MSLDDTSVEALLLKAGQAHLFAEMPAPSSRAGDESQKLYSKAGFNHAKFMNRHEFIEAVIRVALEQYAEDVLAGRSTVNDAVTRTCKCISDHLPQEAKQDGEHL